MTEPNLHDALSFELKKLTPDHVSGSVAIDHRHRQPDGIVHGGVYAALAESLASEGTRVAIAGEPKSGMGMSNATSFLRTLSAGTIHAEGEPLHRGRTTWVWDVRFTDDEGRLCAISRITIAVRPRRE